MAVAHPPRPHAPRVAVLAPMSSELRPVVRALRLRRDTLGGTRVHTGRLGDVDVVATMTGMGTARARRVTTALLDAARFDHVIVVGVAGGIGHEVELGDLIVPEVVIDRATGTHHRQTALGRHEPSGSIATGDELEDDEEVFAQLVSSGVLALDMETSAVAAVCDERGVPWSAFRAISDRPRDGLVDRAVFELGNDDGTANLRAVAKYVMGDPTRAKVLARLGRDLNVATTAAAAAAIVAIRDHTF